MVFVSVSSVHDGLWAEIGLPDREIMIGKPQERWELASSRECFYGGQSIPRAFLWFYYHYFKIAKVDVCSESILHRWNWDKNHLWVVFVSQGQIVPELPAHMNLMSWATRVNSSQTISASHYRVFPGVPYLYLRRDDVIKSRVHYNHWRCFSAVNWFVIRIQDSINIMGSWNIKNQNQWKKQSKLWMDLILVVSWLELALV